MKMCERRDADRVARGFGRHRDVTKLADDAIDFRVNQFLLKPAVKAATKPVAADTWSQHCVNSSLPTTNLLPELFGYDLYIGARQGELVLIQTIPSNQQRQFAFQGGELAIHPHVAGVTQTRRDGG